MSSAAVIEPPAPPKAKSRIERSPIPASWNDAAVEHRVVMSGFTWEQYIALQDIFEAAGHKRVVSFLDGDIEFLMGISREHERLGGRLGRLIERYFEAMRIEHHIWGSASLQQEPTCAGAEPDEGYVLGTADKEYPDFAIEIALTSGGIDKLQFYQRYHVPEVLFFQKGKLRLYRRSGTSYREVEESQQIPGLTLDLLHECMLAPSELAAIDTLLKRVQG